MFERLVGKFSANRTKDGPDAQRNEFPSRKNDPNASKDSPDARKSNPDARKDDPDGRKNDPERRFEQSVVGSSHGRAGRAVRISPDRQRLFKSCLLLNAPLLSRRANRLREGFNARLRRFDIGNYAIFARCFRRDRPDDRDLKTFSMLQNELPPDGFEEAQNRGR